MATSAPATTAEETPAATSNNNDDNKTPKIEFEEYIVQRDDSGIWRKCPYCGTKVWDGPHSVTASGFAFHLNTKNLAHTEKPDWVQKYEKGSWHLGTHSNEK